MQPNMMLARIGQEANEGRVSLPVSFLLEGQLIIGKLVSVEEFLKGVAAGGIDISNLAYINDNLFIHVEIDYIVSGGQRIQTLGNTVWRVHTHAVSGFGFELSGADDDAPIKVIN